MSHADAVGVGRKILRKGVSLTSLFAINTWAVFVISQANHDRFYFSFLILLILLFLNFFKI